MKLDDAGMRHALIEQVMDIFPNLVITTDEENTIKCLDGDKLLIGFTGEQKVREAMVSGFFAGIVKGFHIAVDPMTDPDNLASGKLNEN